MKATLNEVSFMATRNGINIRLIIGCDREGAVSYHGIPIFLEHARVIKTIDKLTEESIVFMDEDTFLTMGMIPVPHRINIVQTEQPDSMITLLQKIKPVPGFWCRKHRSKYHLELYSDPTTILIFVKDELEALRYCKLYRMHEIWIIGGCDNFSEFWSISKSKVLTIYDVNLADDPKEILHETYHPEMIDYVQHFRVRCDAERERFTDLMKGVYEVSETTSIKWKTIASVSNRGHHRNVIN